MKRMELQQTATSLAVHMNGTDAQFFKETGLPVVAHGLTVVAGEMLDRVVAYPIPVGRGNNYSNPDGVRDGNTVANCRAFLAKTGLFIYVPVDNMSTHFFSDVIARPRVEAAEELQTLHGNSAQTIVSQVIPETGIQILFTQI